MVYLNKDNIKMKSFSEEIRDLCNKKPSKVANEFGNFLLEYLSPSFGSMSKRDIDIKIFNMMRKLELISENPEQWDVIRKLKLSSTRARNLIYNANMQNDGAFDDIEIMWKKAIREKLYSYEGTYVLVQIDNPLLIDCIKSVLKKEGFLSDGSFSPDIIRVKPKAYIFLYILSLSDEQQEKLRKILKGKGIIDATKKFFINSVKNVLEKSPFEAISNAFKSAKEIWDIYKGEINVEKFFEYLEEEKKELETSQCSQ